MSRSPLQTTVISYTLIVALNMILSHEIERNVYESVWEDPVVKNLTTTWGKMPYNTTLSNMPHNGTALNSSTSALTHKTQIPEDPEAFYLSLFPRSIFIYVLIGPLLYYWHICLERFFPARPRGVEIEYKKKKKVEVEVSEDLEEEVVKRWIANGRIRRSTVSWWNTFVKWVLEMTVGRIWYFALYHLLDDFLKWRSFSRIVDHPGKYIINILMAYMASFLSITPITSLISFIVVPASKRVIFEAGIDMTEDIFVSAFRRLIIPWFVHTEYIQDMMRNTTEGILKSQAQSRVEAMDGRLIDEL